MSNPDVIGHIVGDLFIGNCRVVMHEPALRTNGIRHVLNVAVECEDAAIEGIVFKKFGVRDAIDEDLGGMLQSCFDFIGTR